MKIFNQSDFRPSDSCEYQLLSIVHDIYASFDCNPPKDVRDISWYLKPLIEYGMRAHLQNAMYWYNRYAFKIVAKLSSKQTPASIAKWSAFIMGTSFSWCTTGSCIRPVVGPLFFLIYINDLTKPISSPNKLFADVNSKWNWCFWPWVEQWSKESVYVGLSMEDVLQSRCFKAGSRGDNL